MPCGPEDVRTAWGVVKAASDRYRAIRDAAAALPGAAVGDLSEFRTPPGRLPRDPRARLVAIVANGLQPWSP